MRGWGYLVLALVALQRVAELIYAQRNTRRLTAKGAVEEGRTHYPLIVALHIGWLASIAVFLPEAVVLDPIWLTVFCLLQAVRIWVIRSLGPYWTTRIITLPDAPLVRKGPYRFLRHPNYAVVAGEIAVLPLVFGEWRIALIFSILNAGVLVLRIRTEDRALASRRRDVTGC